MQALILDGSYQGDHSLDGVRQIVMDELAQRQWAAQAIRLSDLHIRHCLGCFGCWIKMPGVCIIKDEGRDVARGVVQSDLVVLLTPVTFGGYSSELKKAVDRYACSTLLPFFVKVNGEFHHPARYPRRPRLVGVGMLPEPDPESERIFTTLVERNAINFHSPTHAARVTIPSDIPTLRSDIRALFSTVGVG